MTTQLSIIYLKNFKKQIQSERGDEMLALTRKIDESIIIGDDIEIKVLEISGDRVRLGIEAPREITIHRQEVYLEIQAENKEATQNMKETLKKLKGFKK